MSTIDQKLADKSSCQALSYLSSVGVVASEMCNLRVSQKLPKTQLCPPSPVTKFTNLLMFLRWCNAVRFSCRNVWLFLSSEFSAVWIEFFNSPASHRTHNRLVTATQRINRMVTFFRPSLFASPKFTSLGNHYLTGSVTGR